MEIFDGAGRPDETTDFNSGFAAFATAPALVALDATGAAGLAVFASALVEILEVVFAVVLAVFAVANLFLLRLTTYELLDSHARRSFNFRSQGI
jgi:hypothetical protein